MKAFNSTPIYYCNFNIFTSVPLPSDVFQTGCYIQSVCTHTQTAISAHSYSVIFFATSINSFSSCNIWAQHYFCLVQLQKFRLLEEMTSCMLLKKDGHMQSNATNVFNNVINECCVCVHACACVCVSNSELSSHQPWNFRFCYKM